jgi:hypothetical protein
MNDTGELKTLLPVEIVTLSDGTGVDVSPVPFGKLMIFTDSVASLLKKLKTKGIELKTIDDWSILFKVAFEEVVAIMGLVLDKDRAWFNTISSVDGLALLDKIFEQNLNEDAKKKIGNLTNRVRSLL